jgi:maltose alpha-D-glucosyltransferase/alpha-amylase
MPTTTLQDLFHDSEFTDTLTAVLLPAYLPQQRWFTSKGKRITGCAVERFVAVTADTGIALIGVDFGDGSNELYQLPLALNTDTAARERISKEHPGLVLGEITGTGLLSDAVPRPDFRAALYEMVQRGVKQGRVSAEAGKILKQSAPEATSVVPAIDTSNTAIVYNDAFFFKLFRKLDPGINPDLELVRFLSEHTDFDHCPAYGGSLGVGSPDEADYLNLGMMSGKITNRGDAWSLFQELTGRYFQEGAPIAIGAGAKQTAIERARLLGRRTAEMHRALASAGPDRPDLVPEDLSADYRQEITDAALKLLDRQLRQLGDRLDDLGGDTKDLAQRVIDARPALEKKLSELRQRQMTAQLTRIHGDYHLGQVLTTDDDFVIIDFEGEPLLTIPERRRKRPPLKDVAGMVRSFHYAAQGQLLLNPERYAGQDLSAQAESWYADVKEAYLSAYFTSCGPARFLPATEADRQALLELFMLEKAVYEVAYELNSRPRWLPIPLRGVLSLVH